ncbi:Histidine kinase [Sphingomonas paucimobilis]|nr:Histidine kinase [Sphingomonas paucimobilis]
MGRPYDQDEWLEGEQISPLAFAGERNAIVLTDRFSSGTIQQALQISEERYRYTVALSPLIPWIADAGGGVMDIDVRGLERTGLSYEQCMGWNFLSAIHASDRPLVKAAWEEARLTGQPLDYEMRLRQHDGSFRWQRCRAAPRRRADGGILCWYGTIEDIDDRKMADEAVRWSADHDDLTGLWNRRAFMDGLRKALAGAEGSDVEIALLLIDLDGFKSLNDRHGHDAGDGLLKATARRLEKFGAGDALAGRLGGDEFALFIYTADRQQLEATVGELREVLTAPCSLNGQAHICRASIGVALYPAHGKDADGLYKCADLALYEAKEAGGGVRYFKSEMRADQQVRMSELSIARHVLDHDQVQPFYQPKVDLRSGAVVGFEALLRWNDHIYGVHTPAMIPAAFEDAELAIALDQRIFERVAADIASWRKAGLAFGRIAINIAAVQFGQPDFADRLLDQVARAGIEPSSLELEITESVFFGRAVRKILGIFERLRAAGMTIALDDFGTGYASLIHLKQFPIDVLKIDCSFVRALKDSTNAAIVQTVTDLGKRLGITTVAEGVETEAQAAQLRRKGCNLAQGYLFSPAISADQVPAVLAKRYPV